jgi:hypothetical protein
MGARSYIQNEGITLQINIKLPLPTDLEVIKNTSPAQLC